MPPLYLWQALNRLTERFIPFFLNHAFIKALRHTQRPSVKGFVPYLVLLSVDSSRSVYALTLYAIPLSSCQKISGEISLPTQ